MTHTLLLSLPWALLLLPVLLFWRRQRRLMQRAQLIREALRNRDFTFRLSTRGLLWGERALQETLNLLLGDIAALVARREVEAWQRLTRVLTHEIMNATTPITSITQACLADPALRATPWVEGLRAIRDTSRSLTSFVEGYRSLTLQPDPRPSQVALLPLLVSLQTLHDDLHWRLDLPPEATMWVDEGMLRQVLLNLVCNAREAGARTMTVRWDGSLLVGNDGRPIPAAEAAEVFVPFFTTKPSGSGIGLPLSRQLLLIQGWDLALASRNLTGCAVTFVLSPSPSFSR